MGYIVAGPKGCGFSDVFLINKVSILVDFSHVGHQLGIAFTLIWVCFEKKPLSRHYRKQNQQKPFTNYYNEYYPFIYYYFYSACGIFMQLITLLIIFLTPLTILSQIMFMVI